MRISTRIYGYTLSFVDKERFKHFLIDADDGIYSVFGAHTRCVCSACMHACCVVCLVFASFFYVFVFCFVPLSSLFPLSFSSPSIDCASLSIHVSRSRAMCGEQPVAQEPHRAHRVLPKHCRVQVWYTAHSADWQPCRQRIPAAHLQVTRCPPHVNRRWLSKLN